jgi:hypothetical protein
VSSLRALAAAAALALAAAAPAIRLSTPGKGELPRILAPSTAATSRINGALAVLDRRWAAYARDCRAGGRDNEATRAVEVAMAGPQFLSVVAHDDESCGGAHPDTSRTALVYDLDTGRPVDWRRLLGPRLVASTSTDSVIDGTRIGMVSSPELQALYLKAARPSKDCEDVVSDPDLSFQVWLDAKKASVVIEPQLPHVVAACGELGAIGIAALRREGADPSLLAALSAAAPR